jgi:hypothetical protein
MDLTVEHFPVSGETVLVMQDNICSFLDKSLLELINPQRYLADMLEKNSSDKNLLFPFQSVKINQAKRRGYIRTVYDTRS